MEISPAVSRLAKMVSRDGEGLIGEVVDVLVTESLARSDENALLLDDARLKLSEKVGVRRLPRSCFA